MAKTVPSYERKNHLTKQPDLDTSETMLLNNGMAEEMASMIEHLQRWYLPKLIVELERHNVSLVQYTVLSAIEGEVNMTLLAMEVDCSSTSLVGVSSG